MGAFVPVLPYLIGTGTAAYVVAALLAAIALFGVGVSITLFTGRSWLRSGLRQLLIGAAAAAVTFMVGKAIGIGIG